MNQADVTEPRERTRIAAIVPLALLESMRAHDRSREAFQEEELTAGLPKPLGLTGVVESQIDRYTAERKRNGRISRGEVADLIRLVLRRSDGEAILREAGRRIARERVGTGSGVRRLLRRARPHTLARLAAGHAIKRLMRRLTGNATLQFDRGEPPVIRLSHCFTATLDSTGLGCTLYAGILEEAVYIHTADRPIVQHAECIARGAEKCAWKLERPESLGKE